MNFEEEYYKVKLEKERILLQRLQAEEAIKKADSDFFARISSKQKEWDEKRAELRWWQFVEIIRLGPRPHIYPF